MRSKMKLYFFLNIQLHVRHPILSWIRMRPRWVVNTFINIFYHIKIFCTDFIFEGSLSTPLEIYKEHYADIH
jgi:hypothetical protein